MQTRYRTLSDGSIYGLCSRPYRRKGAGRRLPGSARRLRRLENIIPNLRLTAEAENPPAAGRSDGLMLTFALVVAALALLFLLFVPSALIILPLFSLLAAFVLFPLLVSYHFLQRFRR